MRGGADNPMTVEYDTKCMVASPIRAVCVRLEHDGRVPFPEDLPASNTGILIREEDPLISTRYDKSA